MKKLVYLKKLPYLFLLAVLTIKSSFVVGQKQNNHWRFGNSGGIDFNTVPPSFSSGAVLSTGEGSASIADRNTGKLLFYTDGVTVWNAFNQAMPNGTGLLGGTSSLLSSTVAAVIVPKPGNTNLFYLITVDEQSSNNGIRYSIVDMTLNGGLGDIVTGQKNIFLFQTSSEKLEVVPASDGISSWLITHDLPGNSFLSFKIDNSGIQTMPITSSVGGIQGNGAGHMKINKQFNKIAIGLLNLGAGSSTQIELFDFNNTTGIISNAIIWNYTFQVAIIYGVEFSPNGKVLYVSDLQNLVQYDITQPTLLAIQNSAYQVSTSNCTSLQLGIDNKIYVNAGSLNAINCPNKLGAACGYQTNVIANQTGGGGYGLPKWVYYAADTPIAVTNSIIKNGDCKGLPISFSLQNVDNIVSVSWDFGDPASGTANNTSSSLTPQHTYNTAGTYTMKVVINYPCYSDTIPLTFIINPAVVPTFDPIPPFCAGTTAPILPTTSLNVITGTWLPATISNTSSGTYTFTPDTAQCASTQTILTTINSNVVPTFNTVAPIIVGQPLSPLPTTSINGITGTWSPALNNTTTTTYTFTPNAGQCATTTTLTITVNSSYSCSPNGNLLLFSNYDGGVLNIVIDQNIPNIKIGVTSYEPVKINISGPFAGNVTQLLYAGTNSSANSNNCGFPIATTTVNGIPIANTIILTQPVLANGNILNCGYSCTTGAGGCNTIDEIYDYFVANLGGVLYSLKVQYCCWLGSDTYQVSQIGGSCCNNSNSSLTLTSAINTDNQTVCVNNPITNITYSYINATPTLTGLPNGVNYTINNDTTYTTKN